MLGESVPANFAFSVYPSGHFGALCGASGKPRPTKRTGIFVFIRSHSKGGSFWRSGCSGDSHASDIGHWLRMTCSGRGFFITMTCSVRSFFHSNNNDVILAGCFAMKQPAMLFISDKSGFNRSRTCPCKIRSFPLRCQSCTHTSGLPWLRPAPRGCGRASPCGCRISG